MLYQDRGGTGARSVLLLHGLGATGAVWKGVRERIERNGRGEWIAPDLSGHGRSVGVPFGPLVLKARQCRNPEGGR